MDTMKLQPIGSISKSIISHKSHIQMPFARQGVRGGGYIRVLQQSPYKVSLLVEQGNKR